jgi:hypothetical protein
VLYSGWLANTAFFGAVAVRARRRGHSWRQVLPAGYGLSLVGCVAFGAGGVPDMVWHQLLGIERDFSAVLSPTHLLLMASAALILAGPLRSAWHGGSRRAGYGAALSGAFLLAMLTFWGQFNHPFIDRWVSEPPGVMLPDWIIQEMGVQGVVLSASMLSGVVLAMVSRFRLPPGSLTLIMGINAFLITVIEQLSSMVLVALLAGVIGDVLLAVLRPSARRVGQLRLFAFLLPAELYLLYFATTLAQRHAVAGARVDRLGRAGRPHRAAAEPAGRAERRRVAGPPRGPLTGESALARGRRALRRARSGGTHPPWHRSRPPRWRRWPGRHRDHRQAIASRRSCGWRSGGRRLTATRG